MDPDQIHAEAIEAGAKAMLHDEMSSAGCPVERWQSLSDEERAYWKRQCRAAISAYEAAMERPISAYVDGTRALFRTYNGVQFVGLGKEGFFGVEDSGRIYFRDQVASFRPLPQPPKVK